MISQLRVAPAPTSMRAVVSMLISPVAGMRPRDSTRSAAGAGMML